MREPKSSIKIIGLLVAAWGVLELAPIPTLTSNPLTPLFIISHVLPSLPGDEGSRYEKGILDFAFLAFYIIVFSFLRQSITEIFFRPLAKYAGLKSNVKQLRFMEQSYAIFYNLCTVVLGLVSGIGAPFSFDPRRGTLMILCSGLCHKERLGGTRLSTCGWSSPIGESISTPATAKFSLLTDPVYPHPSRTRFGFTMQANDSALEVLLPTPGK